MKAPTPAAFSFSRTDGAFASSSFPLCRSRASLHAQSSSVASPFHCHSSFSQSAAAVCPLLPAELSFTRSSRRSVSSSSPLTASFRRNKDPSVRLGASRRLRLPCASPSSSLRVSLPSSSLLPPSLSLSVIRRLPGGSGGPARLPPGHCLCSIRSTTSPSPSVSPQCPASSSSALNRRFSSSCPLSSSSFSPSSSLSLRESSLLFRGEDRRYLPRIGAAGAVLRFVHNSLSDRWCVVAKPPGWSLEATSSRPSVRAVLQPLLDTAIVARACAIQTGFWAETEDRGTQRSPRSRKDSSGSSLGKAMREAVEGEMEEHEETKGIFFPMQLDADAQGLLLVATDEAMHRQLRSMLQDGHVRRDFRVLADLSTLVAPCPHSAVSHSACSLPTASLRPPGKSPASVSLESLPDASDSPRSASAFENASSSHASSSSRPSFSSSFPSEDVQFFVGGRKRRSCGGKGDAKGPREERASRWTSGLPFFAFPLRWQWSPTERLLAAHAVRSAASQCMQSSAGRERSVAAVGLHAVDGSAPSQPGSFCRGGRARGGGEEVREERGSEGEGRSSSPLDREGAREAGQRPTADGQERREAKETDWGDESTSREGEARVKDGERCREGKQKQYGASMFSRDSNQFAFPASTELRGCLRLWDPRTGELYKRGKLKSCISAKHVKLRLRDLPEVNRLETPTDRLLRAIQKAWSGRGSKEETQRLPKSEPSLRSALQTSGNDRARPDAELKRREVLQLLDGSYVPRSLSAVLSQNALAHSSVFSSSASAVLSEHVEDLLPGLESAQALRLLSDRRLLPSLRLVGASSLAASSCLAQTSFRLLSVSPARTLDGVLRLLGLYRVQTQEPPRSHQIRVHFSEAGCPVANDALYHPSFSTDFRRKILVSPSFPGGEAEMKEKRMPETVCAARGLPEDPFGLEGPADGETEAVAPWSLPSTLSEPHRNEDGCLSADKEATSFPVSREGLSASESLNFSQGSMFPSAAVRENDGRWTGDSNMSRSRGEPQLTGNRRNCPPASEAKEETLSGHRRLPHVGGLLAYDPLEEVFPSFSISRPSQTETDNACLTPTSEARNHKNEGRGRGEASAGDLGSNGKHSDGAKCKLPEHACEVAAKDPFEADGFSAYPSLCSSFSNFESGASSVSPIDAPSPPSPFSPFHEDREGRLFLDPTTLSQTYATEHDRQSGVCASLGVQLFRLTMVDPLKPRDRVTEELVFELDTPPEWAGIHDINQSEELKLWEKAGEEFTASVPQRKHTIDAFSPLPEQLTDA
ncbi:RNA pseudouridine synthase [Toxoplasma gondii GAB2-2007-GAL-DOM2]|uniref:RNA pseudouridine synthase n=3 Tax=Toxoplasma gondii TaxID=5811 RepID=V4YPA0_TOXGV|nr:RNA pseudouridine synthase [Toxoplasma gondii VEG]KFG36260.1 RNA pseudouridine synthase [Toxoplasma gondii p89]KFG41582.1 RNA pseudouridine synthase [Toxoplasma gondii GAB2-2007-GAL-DOM2]CEL71937.1 TPA: hypothetical protein BN1205_052780 [Toxoplasma gondii VEG]